MEKAAKVKLKEEVGEKLSKAVAVIAAEYRGLTVEQLSKLRSDLREVDSEFKVVKNRIAKISIKDHASELESLADSLKGPIGLVMLYGDPAAGAKKVLDFNKDNEKFVVKAGAMDGKAMSEGDIKALSSLPSKEVLLSQIASSIQSPARGIAMVTAGVTRQLVQVCAAIRDTKSA